MTGRGDGSRKKNAGIRPWAREGGIRTGCLGRLGTRGDEWHGVGRYSAENKDFDLKWGLIKLGLAKSLREVIWSRNTRKVVAVVASRAD